MDVEDVLTRALAERGVKVERGADLAEVRDDGAGVRARWRSGAVMDEGRPDGYVGLRCPRAEAGQLLAWLARASPL